MADNDGPRPPPGIHIQPGEQLSPEQLEAVQAHMHADAARMGISFDQYIGLLRAQMAQEGLISQEELEAEQQEARERWEQQQAAGGEGGHEHGPNCNHDHDHEHAHGHAHEGQQVQQSVQPGPPKPEAVALANFLKNQDLKPRTCVFNGQRKDIFRVKRAIRVLQSPAYEKAQKKNALLPPVTDRNSAEAVFKLLPLSLLALRVQKVEEEEEEHEGHTHAKKKRVKGQWNIEVVQQQDTEDDMYYMWLYDGPQWKQRVYSLGALVLVMIFVMFPLWPLKLRQGAWYLSMAFFGLIVLFFVMAIFRLILFCITMFSHPPGLWLFPNLFEDVGFVDSFIPLWAWQEDKKSARKAKRLEKERKAAEKAAKANGGVAAVAEKAPQASGTDAQPVSANPAATRRFNASVEEAEDE